jgi:hypothetical protein
MSTPYNVKWIDCEPTLENFVKNLKTLDELHDLKLMSQVITSYFEIERGKTPYDLEMELRKQNADTGLIAKDWTKDPYYMKLVKGGKGDVITRKYMELKKKPKRISSKYLSDHIMVVSCRSRENVIKETLESSESVEENLEKLKNAGFFYAREIRGVLEEGDIEYPSDDINILIQKGYKLAILEEVDPKVEFESTIQNNPSAKLMVYALMRDGSPIYMITKNNKILSKVGINIYHDEEGNKKQRYVFIS